MSTAQSENVVTLPSNAYATMPAVVFKALSEFAKDTGGRPQLGFIALTGGAAWATDGHKLMRWEIDGAMGTGFEPGKTYTVKPVKLPAGAERVRLEFIAGAPQPMVIAEMKNGGSATFNSEESDLNYPDIQAVYRSAFEKPSPALNENYALNAGYLATIFKHAAAIQKGSRTGWVRPQFSEGGAVVWRCAESQLSFLVMPLRV